MKIHISISHGLVVLLLVMIYSSVVMPKVRAMTNKAVIKSIQSPDGDIIDCVRISHQPAFDHPLLQNHTIQMRPSFHPLGLYDENKGASEMESSSVPQLWHQNGRCPDGTIPIRRTKDDVLRTRSEERHGKKRNRTITNPTYAEHALKTSTHERAIVFIKGGPYNGGKATFNLWNPFVQEKTEHSLAQLWILGGSIEQVNSLEAGWHVSPSMYGDAKPRLFIRWTQDGYQNTGCYNLLCSGFVQVNQDIALGSRLEPISSYGGKQYEITLIIWKDQETNDWWVQFQSKRPLGYWPSYLFPGLSNGASQMQCGGEVLNDNSNGKHTTTQMGSGHFPEEGLGKACYVKNIYTMDHSYHFQDPQGITTSATLPEYYNVTSNADGNIYFGGPVR